MIPICRHIKTDGVRCKANALRDRAYCYYHDRLHRILTRRETTPRNSFVLHPLEDRGSVFLAISDVVCALAAGHIDPQKAIHLIHGLQVAGKYAPNLSSSVAADAVRSVDFTKAGDELAAELFRCTDDDQCESCGFLKICSLEKARAWRAAQDAGHEDDESDGDDEDEENDGDEDDEEDEEEEARAADAGAPAA
jgi:hypothetical protein